VEDCLPVYGEGWRKPTTLDAEPARDSLMVVVNIFLNVAVVILPQLNELLEPSETGTGCFWGYFGVCCFLLGQFSSDNFCDVA